MHSKHLLPLTLLALGLGTAALPAHERRFTYVYEPETLPAGALEFENWTTLRAGRSEEVGKENYNRWDLRQELEYGVTDYYTAALYLNEKAESYRDAAGGDISDFVWKGLSLENRFNVVNPADHPIGVTLYLEGRYSGEEAAVEQKIILGQRHGNWKWALNLEHETEWEDNLETVEGKAGASFGLTRDLGHHWSLGLEVRSESVISEYEEWEETALFMGPVVGYRQEKWWAALTVMPQIRGWNHNGVEDGSSSLDLAGHERLNIRLLFGIGF
ncbi:MAG: hypothetical protein RJA22_104 [Verrucomicrobiota bacterium]|jgi:hypothetical protein